MSDRVKTLIVVTLITLVIWTYAESQSIQLRPFPSVLLQIPAPTSTEDGARVVWLTEGGGSNFQVNLEIEGSAVSIDRIRTDLDDPIDLTESSAFPTEIGTYTLELDDLLREHPIFVDSGLSLVVEPPTVQVQVDTIHRETLKVRVPEIEGVEISSMVPNAELALPLSVWEMHKAAITDLKLQGEQIDTGSLGVGVQNSLTVALEIPAQVVDSPFVEILPATVSVQAKVNVSQSEHRVPTVQINLVIAQAQVGLWNVAIKSGGDDFLRDVTIKGPSDLVDSIADPASGITVQAFVQLTQDQLDEPAIEGLARLGLAGGVTSSELHFFMGGNEVVDVPVQLVITPVEAVPAESGGGGDAGGSPLTDNPG